MSDYKLVPMEPTSEMLAAGEYALEAGCYVSGIYADMLAAAPAVRDDSALQACITYIVHGDADFTGMDEGLVGYFKEKVGKMSSSGGVQGEPVGWQFYQDGKWWNGDDRIKDHKKNTQEAGFRVRDVYAVPQSTEQQPLPCQECGGDGAGGEHEDDCSQKIVPDVSALVEALSALRLYWQMQRLPPSAKEEVSHDNQ